MKTFDALYERLLVAVAKRASDRGILVLAGLMYGGIGLALPLVAGWSIPWLIAANVVGTTLAAGFIVTWLAVLMQQSRRRNLLEWTTDIRRLDAAEFEWLVGELLRREGDTHRRQFRSRARYRAAAPKSPPCRPRVLSTLPLPACLRWRARARLPR